MAYKLIFGTGLCDMKGSVQKEHRTLFALSCSLFKGLSRKSISGTGLQWPTKFVCLVPIDLQCRAVNMKNTAPSVLELFFNSMEFPENPFLALADSSLQRWRVMTRSVDIEGQFT